MAGREAGSNADGAELQVLQVQQEVGGGEAGVGGPRAAGVHQLVPRLAASHRGRQDKQRG